MARGGVDVVKIGEIKVSVQKLCLKQGFFEDTNLDHLTSGWPRTHCFRGDANFDMFPKKMGKKLPNELWARPVASKLSERRPLTFFHRPDTENGQKRYFFAFLQITPMQKFSGGIRGCQMKADVLEVPKMW